MPQASRARPRNAIPLFAEGGRIAIGVSARCGGVERIEEWALAQFVNVVDAVAAALGRRSPWPRATDPDLFTFLSRPVFGTFANDTVRQRNLDAFVPCFDTGIAPAVGIARTLTA